MVKLMHEQVSVKEDSPIIARFYDYEHFTYPWHFHQEFEIIYVEESHGEEFINDSKIHFYPGDILFIGANTPRPQNIMRGTKDSGRKESSSSSEKIRCQILSFSIQPITR